MKPATATDGALAFADDHELAAVRLPETVEYVPHDSFADKQTEQELFGADSPRFEIPQWRHMPEIPEDTPVPHKNRQSLSAGEERVMFLRYNYARYRLSLLIGAGRMTAAARRQAAEWFRRAMKVRSDLVRANLPLVLAMAKRTRIGGVDFGELVSEGNIALLRSVEKFDAARGFKFSTYACRAILKSFNRLASRTATHRSRFPVEYDVAMERSDYDEKRHEMQHEHSLESLREILVENRARLSDTERRIIMERFSIGEGGSGRTLAEVGQTVGLTNERVRQIQRIALDKLRLAMNRSLPVR